MDTGIIIALIFGVASVVTFVLVLSLIYADQTFSEAW